MSPFTTHNQKQSELSFSYLTLWRVVAWGGILFDIKICLGICHGNKSLALKCFFKGCILKARKGATFSMKNNCSLWPITSEGFNPIWAQFTEFFLAGTVFRSTLGFNIRETRVSQQQRRNECLKPKTITLNWVSCCSMLIIMEMMHFLLLSGSLNLRCLLFHITAAEQ